MIFKIIIIEDNNHTRSYFIRSNFRRIKTIAKKLFLDHICITIFIKRIVLIAPTMCYYFNANNLQPPPSRRLHLRLLSAALLNLPHKNSQSKETRHFYPIKSTFFLPKNLTKVISPRSREAPEERIV